MSLIAQDRTPENLYEPIRYTLALGGKRIRPKLVLLATAMCEADPLRALPAAKAVELLHNFTLIHDDIMDKAETRRGKPTVAKKWGDDLAILSGDVLFSIAFEQLNDFASDPEIDKATFSKILNSFLKATRIVCEGQALDMDFETRDNVSLDEYITMIGAKTSALLASSMELGVLVSGASDEVTQAAYDFGWKTGVAFQIQDDLLDATGESGKTGKVVGGDIREGKKTYLSILALERADQKQKQFLSEILGKENISDQEVDQVVTIFETLGVIKAAEDQIEEFYHQASDLLEKFPKNSARDEINKLLKQLMNREN